MLRITVEFVPHGDESRKWTLVQGVIANDGTSGTLKRGNYRFWLSKRRHVKSVWRTGNLLDFPRKSLGPWHLLYRVLQVALRREERR